MKMPAIKKAILYAVNFLFMTAGSLFGQNNLSHDLNQQTEAKVNWAQYDHLVPSAEKDAVINFLFLNSDYCYSKKMGLYDTLPYFIREHAKNINLLDIDFDNDFDIVFNGKPCPGFESEKIEIYLNDSGRYKKILNEWAKIISADFNNKVFAISIYKYSCCGEIQNSITDYRYNPQNFSFDTLSVKFFTNCRDGKNEETFIPKKIKPSGKFSCKSDSTLLRWVSNNEFICSCGCRDNKLAVILPKSATGTILFSRNGWAYVAIDYNAKIILNGLHLSDEEVKRVMLIYGWLPLREINR